MLNELYGLARTLDSCKISVDEWHREYQSLPKVTRESPCIRIWLGNDASVTGLESISADLAGVLRKYGNKQGTFPAFNINPLYRITDMEFIAELDRLKHGKASIDVEKVKSWCIENNWTKGLLGKVMRCLTMCPKKLLEKLDKSLQLENIAIFKLIELCKTMTPNGFRVALEDYIFRELKAGENIELCLSLLFHPGNSKKDRNKDTGTNHSVILDVQDWNRYAYPVANEHTTAWINKQLLLLSGGKIKTPTNGICVDAFGMQFENPEEPMPVVKMESFPVTLRSMFNGQPCQYRYGRIA
ncbi:MAG: hypothetical protein PHQ75_06520, partial [Thermoguttaceae bacterium]|nr:hypothetical protein [Thermoguttaceae bacterium]